MNKLKRGDKVIVISGPDKGVIGTVSKRVNDRKIVVSGVNIRKKHQKPDPRRDVAGGIIEFEAPVDQSNVAILNEETGKADKIGFRIDEASGQKKRFLKSTGSLLD